MRFEQIFDDLTFKHMHALRKRFELLLLNTCDVKKILTMIVRIKLLLKSYLVCSDFSEKYDIG